MQTNFEEFEKVRIPVKKIVGTKNDIFVDDGHVT